MKYTLGLLGLLMVFVISCTKEEGTGQERSLFSLRYGEEKLLNNGYYVKIGRIVDLRCQPPLITELRYWDIAVHLSFYKKGNSLHITEKTVLARLCGKERIPVEEILDNWGNDVQEAGYRIGLHQVFPVKSLPEEIILTDDYEVVLAVKKL